MTGELFFFVFIRIFTQSLVLLIGGIEESFNTKDIKDREQFWQTIGTALKHDAMLGCSISVCI